MTYVYTYYDMDSLLSYHRLTHDCIVLIENINQIHLNPKVNHDNIHQQNRTLTRFHDSSEFDKIRHVVRNTTPLLIHGESVFY